MRRSEAVLQALETGLKATLGVLATVERNTQPPERLKKPLVIIRDGEAGQPQVMLSPRAYSYDHAVRVEVGAASAEDLDAVLTAIDAFVEANRALNGLTEWLEATAPETDVEEPSGALPLHFALFDLTASYTIPTPLS